MQRDGKSVPDCAEVAYDEVKQRRLKLQETDAHKSDRVLANFDVFKKGTMTATDFEPVFSDACDELEEVGMPRGVKEKKRCYLLKIDNARKVAILKDRLQ